jgi:hypothetical protein
VNLAFYAAREEFFSQQSPEIAGAFRDSRISGRLRQDLRKNSKTRRQGMG